MSRHKGFLAKALSGAKAKAGVLSLTLCLLATGVQGVPIQFDIPLQAAPAALKLFSKQSGAQILFGEKLAKVKTNAVKGRMEPVEALKLLLEGTGYEAVQSTPNNFVIWKIAGQESSGSLKGALSGEAGGPLPNVFVTIQGTELTATTDSDGLYQFSSVPAGTYVVIAKAPGYLPLHITEVVVKSGRELVLGDERLRKSPTDPVTLEPYVVKGESVTELDKIEVTDTKQKPFSDSNVDIPRTIDDAQPYYIFSGDEIATSGSTWCQPCLKEMPNVLKAYQDYHDKGFEVIGISLDAPSARSKLADLVAKKQLPWPQLHDSESKESQFARRFSINSIPATILLDQSGKVAFTNLRGKALEEKVRQLLKL